MHACVTYAVSTNAVMPRVLCPQPADGRHIPGQGGLDANDTSGSACMLVAGHLDGGLQTGKCLLVRHL